MLLIILICSFVSLFKSFSLVNKGIVFLVCETKFNNLFLSWLFTSSDFSISIIILFKFSVSVSITDVLFSWRSSIGKRYLRERRDSFTFPTWQSSLADFGKKDYAISHE